MLPAPRHELMELLHDVCLEGLRPEVQAVLAAMQGAWPEEEPAAQLAQLMLARFHAGSLGATDTATPGGPLAAKAALLAKG